MVATRIQWKPAEWLAVCEELYRVHPIACRSSTLTGIKETDVTIAMKKVLHQDRWRASINMTQSRPTLLSQLKFIIGRDEQKARDMAEQERVLITEREGKLKNALSPLAEMLADQVFDYLKPMMDEYLNRTLGASPKAPSDAVVSHHKTAQPHLRKIKVGVIGLLPIQGNDLQDQFPQFDFKFIEGGANSEAVRGIMNMDAIFGLTTKMDHKVENVLKKTPGWEKYHRVAGRGPSSVKRAIQGWMNT
jgi:hypothetical protein